jgi:hypothetical protein
MKMAVFWVVAPCSLVELYQRFRGPCCLHHHSFAKLQVIKKIDYKVAITLRRIFWNYIPFALTSAIYAYISCIIPLFQFF